ncbi:hypothetical protein EMCRGX_G031997 [Ephydatia muelleri]
MSARSRFTSHSDVSGNDVTSETADLDTTESASVIRSAGMANSSSESASSNDARTTRMLVGSHCNSPNQLFLKLVVLGLRPRGRTSSSALKCPTTEIEPPFAQTTTVGPSTKMAVTSC